MTYLIVGLGNPGKTYDDTRHNVGFRVIKALAAKLGITFRPSLVRAKGSLSEGNIRDKKAYLLLPLTYMNESGIAVRKCADYYKIPIERVIVVTDDVALPFGQLRLRAQGSCGGHNGLRSIEAHLGTQEYSRLRIGVSNREEGDLADYVLSKFSQEEQRALPDVVASAIEALELWLTEGNEAAMQKTNK
ncbi:MAG: Peptidyl-tRNA hydrolase [Chlamydiae bacterium]|nr:Peptidyl-tRNA hydrolase [Chlamydiota bacterium]